MGQVTRETSLGGPAASFPETAWSTVLRAKDDGSALGRLIERSWKPLYFFVRRKGADVETAKDQVQAFFAHLLEVRLMDRVVQGRGRFRSFLLAAFDHFLANDYRIRTAEKRGGSSAPLSLDFIQAESQYLPSGEETPEDLYRRAWASDVLRSALDLLRAELSERFEVIRAHLRAEGPRPTYRQSAERLGISEVDFANLLHGARVRLGELILLQVRDTVEDDPADEVSELLRAFRRISQWSSRRLTREWRRTIYDDRSPLRSMFGEVSGLRRRPVRGDVPRLHRRIRGASGSGGKTPQSGSDVRPV